MGVGRKIGLTLIFIAVSPFLAELYLRYTALPEAFGGRVYDSRFSKVEDVFRNNFAWEERAGASVAVFHKGKLVVDLWGGYSDTYAMRKWEEDTMTVVYSSTKAVSAVCVAMLVDRGLLSYDDLVIKYWPEFGVHGKANVTVRMLLSHQAGVAALDDPVERQTPGDHEKMSHILANQKPNWPPGTGSGYHAFTIGWLINQLVRRVDPKGRTVGQFFKEEVALPHDIKDFHIGTPPTLFHRVARPDWHHPMDAVARLRDPLFLFMGRMYIFFHIQSSLLARVFKNPQWAFGNNRGNALTDPEILAQEWPAANGVGTARDLARILGLLLDGKLVSQKTLDLLKIPVLENSFDLVLAAPINWGLGFMMTHDPKDGAYQLGHPGAGGQNVKIDLKHDLAFAYVCNGMKVEMGDITTTFRKLQKAIYDSL